jgi:uncharacterized protein (DUF488 family)
LDFSFRRREAIPRHAATDDVLLLAHEPKGHIDVSKQPPPQDAHWPKGEVFSVGHSVLPIETFITLLKSHGIERVVDIRTVPRSRHNPQFNSDALDSALGAADIQYVSFRALGGLRHASKDSPNTGWRNKSFRGYADYMQTAEFEDALATLIQMSREKRVAIMCAEAVPWRCHRSLVADALGVRGVPVVEILSERSYRMHKLTPFARVEGIRITYPPD